MSAFDGSGSLVSVYFDSDDDVIHIGLSDDPADQSDHAEGVITVRPDDIQQIIDDLVTAYYLRTGWFPEGIELERYLE